MNWMVPGYTDLRELGSGAAGRVVLARHDTTRALVAIKYLASSLARDPGFVAGFRREAQVLGGLDTLHVTRFYEYVEQPPNAAIVMELVDGVALRAMLREHGGVEPEAALVVLKGSLLGLAAAHKLGVVHRDYKPENVIVTVHGDSKLVDFGIAVRAGEGAPVAGTPSYMAPEQWAGGAASPAADVYAATATFFECLTGAPPYVGSDLDSLCRQHTHAAIPTDRAPERLRGLVSAGLAKNPRSRPTDAATFAAELDRIATGAYGEDWEQRGRSQLARRASLLLVLFPLADGELCGTALASTRFSVGRLVAAGILAGSMVAGGLAVAHGATSPGAFRTPGQVRATTSFTTSSPSATSTPRGRRTTSPPSPGSSDRTAPTRAPTATGTTTSVMPTRAATSTGLPSRSPTRAPGSPPTRSTAPPPVPVQAVDVTISSFEGVGSNDSKLVLTVDAKTTAAITVAIRYFGSATKAGPGTEDGSAVLIHLSGSTTYNSVGDFHTWSSEPATKCPPEVWFVRVTTSPAAGNGSQQTYLGAPQCP